MNYENRRKRRYYREKREILADHVRTAEVHRREWCVPTYVT